MDLLMHASYGLPPVEGGNCVVVLLQSDNEPVGEQGTSVLKLRAAH